LAPVNVKAFDPKAPRRRASIDPFSTAQHFHFVRLYGGDETFLHVHEATLMPNRIIPSTLCKHYVGSERQLYKRLGNPAIFSQF
jgi:hypothetical protein